MTETDNETKKEGNKQKKEDVVVGMTFLPLQDENLKTKKLNIHER